MFRFLNPKETGSVTGGILKLTFGLKALSAITGRAVGRLGVLTARILRVTTVFAAAIGAVVAAMFSATAQLRQMGNAVSDIRGSTGLGSRASYGLLRNFRAFGLNPSVGDTNPMMMAQMNRVYGLGSPTGAGYISSLAGRYQGMSPMMRNQMLQNLGIDSPEMRRTLMTPTGMLRHQEQFTRKVEDGFGVDPREAEHLSQRLNLVNLQFQALSQGALLKLGTTVLPRVLNVLENIADKAGDNSADLGAKIEQYTDLAFAKLIQFAEFVLRIPDYFDPVKGFFLDLADHLLNIASTLSTALPSIFQGIVKGVSVAQNALEALWRVTEKGFSSLLDLAPRVGQSFLNLLDVMEFTAGNIGESLKTISDGISQFLKDILENPLVRAVLGNSKVPWGTGDSAEEQAFRAQDILRPLGKITAPIRKFTENALKSIGVSPALSAAGGLLVPGAVAGWGIRKAAGWGLGALTSGGAGAGAAAGTGAATSAAAGISVGGILSALSAGTVALGVGVGVAG